MTKKRKSDANLDDADQTIYASFRSAANSLSHLYSQASTLQKLAFRSGERNSLEKLLNWISSQEGQGLRVTAADVLAYVQQELDSGEDSPVRMQLQNQHQHSLPSNSSPSNLRNLQFGQVTVGSGPRSALTEQPQNPVFSNSSSPVPQNLQPDQLTQGRGYYQSAMAPHDGASHNREDNSAGSDDTDMDMH